MYMYIRIYSIYVMNEIYLRVLRLQTLYRQVRVLVEKMYHSLFIANEVRMGDGRLLKKKISYIVGNNFTL